MRRQLMFMAIAACLGLAITVLILMRHGDVPAERDVEAADDVQVGHHTSIQLLDDIEVASDSDLGTSRLVGIRKEAVAASITWPTDRCDLANLVEEMGFTWYDVTPQGSVRRMIGMRADEIRPSPPLRLSITMPRLDTPETRRIRVDDHTQVGVGPRFEGMLAEVVRQSLSRRAEVPVVIHWTGDVRPMPLREDRELDRPWEMVPCEGPLRITDNGPCCRQASFKTCLRFAEETETNTSIQGAPR